MARRRNGLPLHGWVCLDKPRGRSSAWAVEQVRRILGAAKAGHAGTLDPLASGVLPVAVGEATKTVAFVQNARKTYTFTVRWGEARDTDDAEGAVTATSPARPTAADVARACLRFVGDSMQAPPGYSARNVGGRRSYALARQGEAPAPPPRPVRIEEFECIAVRGDDHADFRLECGKGTYVRALARDLAAALGTVGHVTALRREAVGRMIAERAISLETLAAAVHSAGADAILSPLETALADIPALPLNEDQAQRLRQGQAVQVPTVEDGAVCVMGEGRPIAVAEVRNSWVRPVRVFNL